MKKIFFAIVLVLNCWVLSAQQDIFVQNKIVSPEIHQDNTVTFRVKAPHATSVSVSGNMDVSHGFADLTLPLQKGEDGVWSVTTAVLSPELYRYFFTIDGVRTVDPGNAFVIRDVASVSNIFLIGGGQADLYKVNKVSHGTLSFRWYNSPRNSMNRRLTVYTPAGYESSNKKYPVLYLLHGIGGDEEAWISSGRLVEIMDNLIAQRKATPMIVVMTNGNVSQEAAPGNGSDGFKKPEFMLPHTMDGKFEETFMDVIDFIDHNYRTINNKAGRAIAGLSMGGFHTAYISMNYPDKFAYVGLFSAAIGVKPGMPSNSEIYKDVDVKLEKQKQFGLKLYWIAIGKDDKLVYPGLQDYLADLNKIGLKYEYLETAGGHTWNNWRVYLTTFTPQLFK